MKSLFSAFFLLLGCNSRSHPKTAEAWSDVKQGVRQAVRGTAKGIKAGANKVEENMSQDDRQDKAEARK